MADPGAQDQGLRLHRLIEASRVINSTLDLDRLLVLIVETAVQSVGADRGTLYLVDEAGRELWSKVLQGTEVVEIRLPLGTGIAGHVAQTGEPALIADAYRDPRFNPAIDRRTGYRTRAVLCMPLQDRAGRTVGVFQLLNKEGGFDREDLALIEALAAQAAVAIDHARMAREMVRNERLAAVGRMAGSLVHDLKGPLATLRLTAELLRLRARDQETRELADGIVHEVDRFLGMAREILDFTRGGGELHLEQVALVPLLEGFLRSVAKDLERGGVRLERDLRYAGAVRADRERLRRAFGNIVANAIDAMPRGGTLRVGAVAAPGGVRVEFADSGAGMPEEIRRRIGEPFLTHGKPHGTGLGMAMVKKTVDEHGGTLEVESAPGAGTAVRITLPA